MVDLTLYELLREADLLPLTYEKNGVSWSVTEEHPDGAWSTTDDSNRQPSDVDRFVVEIAKTMAFSIAKGRLVEKERAT